MKSILSLLVIVLPFFTYAQICTKYTLVPDTADVNVLTEFQVQEINGGIYPPELWVCNWVDFENDNSHECVSVNTCQHTFTTGGWHAVSYEITEPLLGNTAVCTTSVYVSSCNTGPVIATADALPDSVVRCAGTQLTLGLSAPSAAFCSGVWEYCWFDGTNYYDGTGFNSNVEVWSAAYQYVSSGTLQTTKTFKGKIRCSTSYSCTDSSSVKVKIQNVDIFTLAGGNTYCTGSTGTSDTLSGSQLGVNYQLKKNGADYGAVVPGTGNALIWTNLTAGTYTVVATNIASPYCIADMSGAVIITETLLPTVTQISNISACPQTLINIGDFVSNPTGATFTWTNSNIYIGLAASGSGNIPQWTGPANVTGANIVGSITVRPWLNGCQGPPMSFTVTILPTPTVNPKTNLYACPGSSINIGNFVSLPYGASFEWTNSNTAIGLAASGSGNIPQWIAPANNTGVNIVGTITVTPTLNGCQGPPMSFTITIKPSPVVNQINNIAVCPGSQVVIPGFTSNPAGATFSWTNSNTNIGLAASGSGNIASWNAPANNTGANIVGTIYVTPTLNGCSGYPMSFTVTIYATPTVNQIANISVCPGSQIVIPCFTSIPTGATFTWTNSNTAIGLVTSGSGCIPAWTAPVNNTGSIITSTFTITASLNGCVGPPMSFTISIKPTPTVAQVSNIAVCPGSTITIANFASNPSGASYIWTNSNTAIGLAASGTDNIASWTAPANNTGANITATIAVTPILNGCSGTPKSFNVSIYPSPAVTQKSNIEVCAGELISIGSFVSIPMVDTFAWTNTNIMIGLTSNGTGNISSWIAPPNCSGPSTVGTITVTPVLNGCWGTPMSFTVTVKCQPYVTPIADIAFCPGSAINIDPFTSFPAGATYEWTNSNTAIGLAASGSGNITGWTAPTNNTGANITGTIAVTPTLNGCVGPPMSFTVIIYPTSTIYNLTGGGTYCVGGTGLSDTLSGSQLGVNYQLKKNGVNYGTTVPGTGSALIWNNLTAGTYMVVAYYTAYPNCLVDMNNSVVITEAPLIGVNAGTDLTIPYGTTTTLNAVVTGGSGNYIYAWQPSGLLVNPNAPSSLTNNINAITQFVVTVNDINTGCVNADSMYVYITGGPLNVTAVAQPLISCSGDTIFLNALVSGGTGSYTYTWISNPPGLSADSANPYVLPTVNTEYTVLVNDGFNNATSNVYVSIRPQPQLFILSGSGAYCSGTNGLSDTLSGSQLGVNYQLVKNGADYGPTVPGTGNALIWSNLTAGTYTVVATYDTPPHCTAMMNGSVVITEKPTPTVVPISNIAVCPGTVINMSNFVSVPAGATFTWTNSNTLIGLAASGIGNISQWTAPANSTCANITGTITVTPILNGCQGAPMTFTITIYPTPTVIPFSNIIVCPGTTIYGGGFASCPSGATFTWTNSNPAIGIPASGSGNIPTWTAPANATGVSIISTITVTPTLNGCIGTPMSFTITVKPTPSVNQITNITACPSSQIAIPCFTSIPSGVTFAWTNSNTAIGLAASGSGCIASWIAPVNNTGANIVSTIQVIPSLNGCTGTPMTFSIAIKPTPTVLQISNIAVCPDEVIVIDNFVSLPVNGTFDWTNSNTAIGLVASGSGNIPQWTAPANNTGSDMTGTITVTPSLNGCPGTPMSFTVTIHAASVGGSIAGNTSVCLGAPVTLTLNSYSGNIISWRKRLNGGSWTNITFTGSVYSEIPSSAGVWEYYAVVQNLPCAAAYSGVATVTVSTLPTIFNLTGDGAYCTGSAGASDTLSGSQIGVNYQLKKNGADFGPVVAGTGSPLIWNNLTAGTYMVVATYSTSPYCVADMNGQLTVVEHPAPVAFAGLDKIVSQGGTTILIGTASGGSGAYSYHWAPELLVVKPDTQMTYTLPINNSTAFTVYVTDSLTSCSDSDVVNVVVMGGPLSVSASVQPSFICAGDTVHLTSIPSGGSGTYTYAWTSNPPGFTSNLIDTFAAPTVSTTYIIEVEDGSQQAFASVNVIVNPAPVVYTLSGGGAYCTGSNGVSDTLSGSQLGVNYQLIKNGANYGAVVAGTGNALIWNNLTTGTYMVVATSTTAPYCAAAMNGSVDIVENPLPVVFAGYDQTIISGVTANLNVTVTGGSGHYSYQWSPAILVTNPTAQSTTTIPLVITQQFIVFVYDSVTTCTQSDTVNINQICCGLSVNATAQPNTICIGDTVHLNATANGGSGSYTYTWTSNPPGFTSIIQNPVISPTATNQYIVVVNDGSQTASNAVNVVVNTPPVINLGADTTLCLNQNITLTGPSGSGYSYTWIKLPGDTLSYAQYLYLDTAIVGSGTATYVLTAGNNNCFNSDTIIVGFDVCPLVAETNDYQIKVFPNPAKGYVAIDWDKSRMDKALVEMIDIYGRLVFSNELNSRTNKINLQGFSTGVYVIRIISGTVIYTSKLIIEK